MPVSSIQGLECHFGIAMDSHLARLNTPRQFKYPPVFKLPPPQKGGPPLQGPERLGPFRAEYERNRRKVLQTRSVCGICGKPVDKSLKYPDPMSPTVDHIIPIARGGHPSDIDNLQLAHLRCNRAKSDSLPSDVRENAQNILMFPQSCAWIEYCEKS